MQVIYKNENKGSSSRRIDIVDLIICTKRVGRYIEEEYTGGLERRITRIWDYREVFNKS